MPTTAGVRDLKNSLSKYLRLVRSGESVVVLDRGRPVAMLCAVPQVGAGQTLAERLASLAARGLITLGTVAPRRARVRGPRVNLSRAVEEDREERA